MSRPFQYAWLLCALWLTLTTSVRGEILPPPAPGGFGWKLNFPVGLLRDEQVRRELRLTDRAIARVEALAEEIASGNPSSGHLDPAVLSIPDRFKARWAGLLTAEQRSRLHQIELQRAPLLQVLSEPEVARQLMLSTEQATAIREIFKKDYYRNAARAAKDLEPIDDTARMDVQLNTFLTMEQKLALEELRGNPVASNDK
jgi:hypothetical protein